MSARDSAVASAQAAASQRSSQLRPASHTAAYAARKDTLTGRDCFTSVRRLLGSHLRSGRKKSDEAAEVGALYC